MAIEGISGAVSTYQTAPQVTKVEQADNVKTVSSYSGEDGTVSEISKDTRIVNNTDDTSSGQSGEGGGRQPSEETMKQALSDINKRLNNTECVFGYHEKTNRVTIQIVDKDTKEVIKEVPPEKTLDMIAKAWELAGILVDERL
jgi:flagellar protein FlaG